MDRTWPSREALYELVWSKPAEEVAADLGITGTALSKVCARRNIPKPPRGYWARVKAGQKVKRVPLPKSDRPVKKPKTQPSTFVPPPVTQPAYHPRVVQRTERAYEKAQMDVWGRLVPSWTGSREYLDLMVSQEALPRALQVMSRLVQEARAAGMTVTVKSGATILEVKGEEVKLRLKEKVQAQEGLPMMPSQSSWATPSRQKARGTGELSLLVLSPVELMSKTAWRDGPIPVEDQLPHIVATFRDLPRRAEERRRALAEAAERRRQQEQEAERQRQFEAQRQAELRRRREEEQACREMLRGHAQQWEESQRLRAYLDWLKERGPSGMELGEFEAWLTWAERELEALDPVSTGGLSALIARVQRMAKWPPVGSAPG